MKGYLDKFFTWSSLHLPKEALNAFRKIQFTIGTNFWNTLYIDICLACFFYCMICSWVHTALFFTFIEENRQQFVAQPQFPAKWCLRNMRRNSLLMIWLGSASDFLKLLHPVRRTTSDGSRPWDRGGGGDKIFFQAPVWSKNKWGEGGLGRLGPSPGSTTDYPEHVISLEFLRSFLKIILRETSGNIDPKMLAVLSGYFRTAFNRWRRRALLYKIFKSIR